MYRAGSLVRRRPLPRILVFTRLPRYFPSETYLIFKRMTGNIRSFIEADIGLLDCGRLIPSSFFGDAVVRFFDELPGREKFSSQLTLFGI